MVQAGLGCLGDVQVSMDRLEGQIVKSTDLSNNREFAKSYLRKISVDIIGEQIVRMAKTDNALLALSRSSLNTSERRRGLEPTR